MNFLKQILRQTCSHRFTWPRTDGNGHDYQICLACGTAYEYDWKLMRRTRRLPEEPAQPGRNVTYNA
ncbi:MAG TPA: hypothetical protein VFO46_25850 [Candidatus Sulfotelmatobacter sp.]|nr:hypothetical protein [Candidatus Sulfotelmatobacter sp.]